MSTLLEIESAIEKLSADDFGRLRDWLSEHDQQLWDKQLASDVVALKLDRFAEEAIADF